MTLVEALDHPANASAADRLRYLATEHPDPATRAKYAARAIAKASGLATRPVMASEAVIPLDEVMRLRRIYQRCQFRSRANCGCSGMYQCALAGRDVRIDECLACVRKWGW